MAAASRPGILGAVGRTPIARLTTLAGPELAGVWVKLEGANLVAALRVAERLGPGQRVVTVQVDSGLKYLSTGLYA